MIKQIPNFSNYKISDEGKLYRHDGAEIKPFQFANGYLQVVIKDDNSVRYTYEIHRLVAKTSYEDYTEDCVVCHKDRNRTNNCIDNLMIYPRSVYDKLPTHIVYHYYPTMTYQYIEGDEMSKIVKRKLKNIPIIKIEL